MENQSEEMLSQILNHLTIQECESLAITNKKIFKNVLENPTYIHKIKNFTKKFLIHIQFVEKNNFSRNAKILLLIDLNARYQNIMVHYNELCNHTSKKLFFRNKK